MVRSNFLTFVRLSAACVAATLAGCGGGGGSTAAPAGGRVVALIKDAPLVTTSDGKTVATILIGLAKVELVPSSGAPVTIFDASAPGSKVKRFDLLSLQTTDFFGGVGAVPSGSYTRAILTLDPVASFDEAVNPVVTYPLSVSKTTTIDITPPLTVQTGQVALAEFDIRPTFITATTSGGTTTYALTAVITATPASGSNGHDVDGIGVSIVAVDAAHNRLQATLDDGQMPTSGPISIDLAGVGSACLTDFQGLPITLAQVQTLLAASGGTLEAEVQGTILANGDITATCVALQDQGGQNDQNDQNDQGGSANDNHDELFGTIQALTVNATAGTGEFDLAGARVAQLHVLVDSATVVTDGRMGATQRRLTINDLKRGQTAEVEGAPVTAGTTTPIRATRVEIK